MKEKVLSNLEILPFFTKTAMTVLEKVHPKTLDYNISSWVKKGLIIRLKNGLYVTKTFIDRNLREGYYLGLVAGRLVTPSYLSLEYVLQKNGLLTEATYTISSITIKTTRRYFNKLGAFTYTTIKPSLYFGYKRVSYGNNFFYEAEVSKALFDYFYMRLANYSPEDPRPIEEERINWSNVNRKEFKNFVAIIRKSKIKRMIKLIPLLEDIYGDSH